MRRLAVALLLAPALLGWSSRPHPDWISNCSSSHWGTSYAALCGSGNARYMARAVCYKPWGGYVYDYGSYVWPGTSSYGSCPTGYSVGSVGWTQ